MDGEGAPPGGSDAQAATMRVNEKYSTLPAEDRSVHIINICAIEDVGYLPSEGTVSAGGRDRAGGPITCARGWGGGAPGREGDARPRTWGPGRRLAPGQRSARLGRGAHPPTPRPPPWRGAPRSAFGRVASPRRAALA